MKNRFFYLLVSPLLMVACQSNQTTENKTDSAGLDSNITPMQECYSFIKNKDTATLTIMTVSNIVTGQLKYSLFEKDKNEGLIEGEMRGDTLLAEYTFNAEGTESTRQVAYLKKGNQLQEGFGDVEEKNGKMMFKDTKNLKFGEAIVFEKVDCN